MRAAFAMLLAFAFGALSETIAFSVGIHGKQRTSLMRCYANQQDLSQSCPNPTPPPMRAIVPTCKVLKTAVVADSNCQARFITLLDRGVGSDQASDNLSDNNIKSNQGRFALVSRDYIGKGRFQKHGTAEAILELWGKEAKQMLPGGVTQAIYKGMTTSPSISTNLTRVPYWEGPLGQVHEDSGFQAGRLVVDSTATGSTVSASHAPFFYDAVLTKTEQFNETDLGLSQDEQSIHTQQREASITKFYMMQVVELSESSFGLLTKWGVAGHPGFSEELIFPTLEEALQLFHDRYKKNMGVSWSAVPLADSVGTNASIKATDYQRRFPLEHDLDAYDVLLSRPNDSEADMKPSPEVLALSFRQPKPGHYTVETSTYLPQGGKTKAASFMFKNDLLQADQHFRSTFWDFTGHEWHERHPAWRDGGETLAGKYRYLPQVAPAAVYAGYIAQPSIRTDLRTIPTRTSHSRDQVDPETLLIANGTIASVDGAVANVMLWAQDSSPKRKEDTFKYYLLQMVQNVTHHGIVARWGLEGTPGFMQELLYDDRVGAEKRFRTKFRQKTGRAWKDGEFFDPVIGKYSTMQGDAHHLHQSNLPK